MTRKLRIIVAGGRDFDNYKLLSRKLDHLLSNVEPTIISGGAVGADLLGEKWAIENESACERFPAEWDKYGKSAGYRRNEVMAMTANALVAFWDGKSKGTKHMIDIATEHGLKVRVIRY